MVLNWEGEGPLFPIEAYAFWQGDSWRAKVLLGPRIVQVLDFFIVFIYGKPLMNLFYSERDTQKGKGHGCGVEQGKTINTKYFAWNVSS